MQPGDRFDEIVDRHGEDSIVAQSRAQARPEMYGMVGRTLRRASKAQPPADRLEITLSSLAVPPSSGSKAS